MQHFHIIIPARYQSVRLPGKPLLNLAGKPMIEHVYERAQESGANSVTIATDDERIAHCAEQFGADVCITASSHQSGTDRLAEVVDKLKLADDTIIVNVQGDEPLIPSVIIHQVAKMLYNKEDLRMASLCAPLQTLAQLNNPNLVKVVRNQHNEALYFSRSPIPHHGELNIETINQHFRHIGIYAYRVEFLKQFVQWPVAPIEHAERLEQLRALWHGVPICVDDALEVPHGDVNTQADLEQLNQLMIH